METNNKTSNLLIPLLLFNYIIMMLLSQALALISPVIASEFSVSASVASLPVTLAGVTVGVTCIVCGTLSDFIPVRKLLIASAVLFGTGCLTGFALQGSFYAVIVARVLQSMGAGAMGSICLVSISRYCEGAKKIKYFGYYGAMFQFASGVGIVLGGFLTTYIKWQYLFIFPVVALLVIPYIYRILPKEPQKENKKIDIVGLSFFSTFVLFLILYFSIMNTVFVGISIAALLIFIVYIAKNEHAFINIHFFKNTAFRRGLLIELVLYSVVLLSSYSYGFILRDVFEQGVNIVSSILLPSYIAATVMGILSGKIRKKIGREKTIFISCFCKVTGFLICAVLLEKGPVVLTLGAILSTGASPLMYSSIIDITTNSLENSQKGRGLGFFDLFINISQTIGLAIFGNLLAGSLLSGFNLFGIQNTAAVKYSNVLFLGACMVALGYLIYFVSRKHFKEEKNEGEKGKEPKQADSGCTGEASV